MAPGPGGYTVAEWVSTPVLALLDGPMREGKQVGHGYVAFNDYILALTPTGAPRLPNGIHYGPKLADTESIAIGRGTLSVGSIQILPGMPWDPVPSVIGLQAIGPPCRLHLRHLAGRGEGLTPAGDDILIGYVASLTLIAGRQRIAATIAESAGRRTTSLSATLLRHAARGEVPEPIHQFLQDGDARQLLRFGHSSGRCMLIGLLMGAGISTEGLLASSPPGTQC